MGLFERYLTLWVGLGIGAGVGLGLVQRGRTVHLSTTYPVAHLVVMLDGKVPGLHVSRIDPKVEIQRYIDKIMAAKPPNLDAQQQALMQEDLRRASVEPYAWVLNKSVLGAGTHDPLLAARLAGECKQIERMSAGLAKRLFTLPWLTVPPIGCVELSKLVRSPTSSAASDTNHSGIH